MLRSWFLALAVGFAGCGGGGAGEAPIPPNASEGDALPGNPPAEESADP